MPKAFPKEFREDVNPGLQRFGCLDGPGHEGLRHLAVVPRKRWLAIDECDSARRSRAAPARSESDALREANKRIKLLEQENEVLRRTTAYLSQAHLPGR